MQVRYFSKLSLKSKKIREGLENKIISLNQLKNKLIEDGGENQIEIY